MEGATSPLAQHTTTHVQHFIALCFFEIVPQCANANQHIGTVEHHNVLYVRCAQRWGKIVSWLAFFLLCDALPAPFKTQDTLMGDTLHVYACLLTLIHHLDMNGRSPQFAMAPQCNNTTHHNAPALQYTI